MKPYWYYFNYISGATIGFNSTTYSASEGAGGANLTVSVLNGALASDTTVYVGVTTLLTGGTATGIYIYIYIYILKSNFEMFMVSHSHTFSYGGLHIHKYSSNI